MAKKIIEDNTGNGWDEWKNYVLKELKRLNFCLIDLQKNSEPNNSTLHKDIKEIFKGVGKINVEIGMLKVKSSIFGAVGGLIPVIIGLGIYFITKG